MIEEIINIKTGKKALKSFGNTMGIIILIFSIAFSIYDNDLYIRLSLIGFLFIFLSSLLPVLLKPAYLIWTTFSIFLGWTMTRLILSFIFYLVITPIGLIAKIFGEDFLALKKVDNNSYWNSRDREMELNQDYEKQY